MAFSDILYAKADGVAKITINRPKSLNAFTWHTLLELGDALEDAEIDRSVGVIVLTGAGDRAFCVGGDVRWEAEDGLPPATSFRSDPYAAITMSNKPVIAMVNGYAIGGGHVLHLVCDLSIASETARFGQNGPRVGSFNPWGLGYLTRVVGEKKAREIWLLCRQYSAEQALAMGLVNAVVPPDKLEAEVNQWCQEILALGPEALRACKEQFQLETAQYIGRQRAGGHVVEYLQRSEEAREGQQAFMEKRRPDFSKFRR